MAVMINLRKKNAFLADASSKGGGEGGPPAPVKDKIFFL